MRPRLSTQMRKYRLKRVKAPVLAQQATRQRAPAEVMRGAPQRRLLGGDLCAGHGAQQLVQPWDVGLRQRHRKRTPPHLWLKGLQHVVCHGDRDAAHERDQHLGGGVDGVGSVGSVRRDMPQRTRRRLEHDGLFDSFLACGGGVGSVGSGGNVRETVLPQKDLHLERGWTAL
eukprot:364321-Chlamydomonas_euryale.AAC.9